MFAGDGTAGGQAKFEDFHRERESGVFLAGDGAIVENQRMKVAVASMKNVGHAQAVFPAKACDFAHYLREGGAGNHTVLDDVVGRNVTNRGEGGLASFPNEGTLGVGLRYANFPGAIRTADFVDLSEQSFDFGQRAIELDKQEATAIG